MPYDPRMYEPNPGRDPATYIHQWDQPLNPRGDMPMQAPGVDPMSFELEPSTRVLATPPWRTNARWLIGLRPRIELHQCQLRHLLL